MANCLDEAGHIVLFIFFTVFGLCFQGLSTAYFVNLIRIDKPHACVASLMTLTDPQPDLTTPCSVHMTSWKGLAVTGIIYGSIYVLAGIFQLGRSCESNSGMSRSTMKNVTEKKETRFWTCCFHFFNSSVYFLVVMVLWLMSLIVPAYLAVNLYKTDAIWTTDNQQDDIVYYLALTLLVFCIVNFVVVVITCVAVCMEEENEDEEQWNVYKHSDSPSSVTI